MAVTKQSNKMCAYLANVFFCVFFHRIHELAEKAFKEHFFMLSSLPNTWATVRIGKRVFVISKIFKLERIESAD